MLKLFTKYKYYLSHFTVSIQNLLNLRLLLFITIFYIFSLFSASKISASDVLPFDCKFTVINVTPSEAKQDESEDTVYIYKGYKSLEFAFNLKEITPEQWKKLPSRILTDNNLRLFRDSPPIWGEEISVKRANKTDIITGSLKSDNTNGGTAGAWGPHEIHLQLPDGQDLCRPGKYEIVDFGHADIKIDPVSIQQILSSSTPSYETIPALPDVDAYWKVTISNARFTQGFLDDKYQINLNTYLNTYNLNGDDNFIYLFDKGNINIGIGRFGGLQNRLDETVSFILKPLQEGTYSIRMYGRWASDLALFTTILDEASFTVYAKDKVPKPSIIPDICISGNGKQAAKDNDCSDAYIDCPWCSTIKKQKSKPYLPKITQLCDQLPDNRTDVKNKSYRERCNDCVNQYKMLWTAVGCVPISYTGFINKYVLGTLTGLAGGIAFLYFLWGAFKFLTSAGNAEKLEEAKQVITSSLAGIILIIFSIFLLKFIGVDVLGIFPALL